MSVGKGGHGSLQDPANFPWSHIPSSNVLGGMRRMHFPSFKLRSERECERTCAAERASEVSAAEQAHE